MGQDLNGEFNADEFGTSVSLSSNGTILAVGAPYNPHPTPLNPMARTGHVRVFVWDGTNWMQIGQDIDGEGGRFGLHVKLSADGRRLAASADRNTGINPVTGVRSNSFSGSVHVYEWMKGAWVQMGSDIDGDQPYDYFGSGLDFSASGDRLIAGAYQRSISLHDGSGYVKILDWTGTQWKQVYKTLRGRRSYDHFGFEVTLARDGKLATVSNLSDGNFGTSGETFTYDLFDYALSGRVVIDSVPNCIADSFEKPLLGVPLIIQKNRSGFVIHTDSSGSIHTYLDTGIYTIRPDLKVFPYREACPPFRALRVDSITQVLPPVDFVLQDTILCSFLTVEITAPRIRRCFNSRYYVSYCNRGTADAHGAYVEVNLDPHLQYHSSNISLGSQQGSTLTFPLGTIAKGSCGSFFIDVTENCLSDLGEVICTEAHIFPDTLCRPINKDIRIREQCIRDSLKIDVSARTSLVPDTLGYIILDNQAIVDTGSIIFRNNHDTTLVYTTNGKPEKYQFVLDPDNRFALLATSLTACRNNAVTRIFIISPKKQSHSL
jgi:hypothetical protein